MGDFEHNPANEHPQAVVATMDCNYGFISRPLLDLIHPEASFQAFPLEHVGMPYYLQALFTHTHKGFPMAVLSSIAELERVTKECDERGCPYRTKIVKESTSKRKPSRAEYRVIYLGAMVT